jgi:hypothetical protein
VSCPRDSPTKALDGGEYVVSGLGPSEGLGATVLDVNVVANSTLQFDGTAVCAATKLFVGELGEESLDLVDPGTALGCEMDVKTGPSQQPALDQRRLVSSVVVQDEMNCQLLWDVAVDGVEELPKLDAAVTSMVLRDDPATLYVERSKQGRGAVTNVVMRATFDLSGLQRQDGLGTIQRLNLGFLVNTENHRTVRRIQVETHDVPHLLHQERIRRKLEALATVRPQPKCPPNPSDAAAAQTDSLRQGAGAPVRGVPRLTLQSQRHCLLNRGVADFAWRTWPGLVEKAVDTASDETCTPATDGPSPHSKATGHFLVVTAIRARQNDPRSHGQRLRRASASSPPLEFLPLLGAQHQSRFWPASSHLSSPCIGERRVPRYSCITSESGH